MEPQQRNIIIIVVVVLLLCCCCAALGIFGWFYGDALVGTTTRLLPTLAAL